MRRANCRKAFLILLVTWFKRLFYTPDSTPSQVKSSNVCNIYALERFEFFIEGLDMENLMWKSEPFIYLHDLTKRTTYWVLLCRYLSDTSFLIVIVSLLLYRTRGCFTSNGLTIVDILPSTPSDLTPLQTSTHSKGILIPSSFPVHPPALSYNSDSEFLRSVSESDSASDCGSDVLSEPGTQVCTPCKWNLVRPSATAHWKKFILISQITLLGIKILTVWKV